MLELSVVPGEFRNDTSASLMTIADLSTVWVTSQVPESYIRFVQVGERVEINLVAYPGETFEGRVSRIADTVDPQTRTVKVQAEMDNRQRPIPARDVRQHPPRRVDREHRRSFPVAAVVQDGDRAVVFVEQAPGHFEERRRVDREARGRSRAGPERRHAGRVGRRRRRDAAQGPRQADASAP